MKQEQRAKILNDYFKWHYKHRDTLVPADLADYWLDIIKQQKEEWIKEIERIGEKYECDCCGGITLSGYRKLIDIHGNE